MDIKQSMPEDLVDLYETLKQEAIWLHAEWKILCQLFTVSKERVKFLDSKARSFFKVIQRVLRDDVFMSLSRLTDPPQTGKRKNLSLARLGKQLKESGESDFYKSVSESIDRIQDHCEPFRKWRNRVIAHKDLLTALKYHPEPLPGISRKMVEDALRMIREFLNHIQVHFEDSETLYEHVVLEGDGEAIVTYLQQADEQETWTKKHGIPLTSTD